MRIHCDADLVRGFVLYEPEFADEGLHELHWKIAIRRKAVHARDRRHKGGDPG